MPMSLSPCPLQRGHGSWAVYLDDHYTRHNFPSQPLSHHYTRLLTRVLLAQSMKCSILSLENHTCVAFSNTTAIAASLFREQWQASVDPIRGYWSRDANKGAFVNQVIRGLLVRGEKALPSVPIPRELSSNPLQVLFLDVPPWAPVCTCKGSQQKAMAAHLARDSRASPIMSQHKQSLI